MWARRTTFFHAAAIFADVGPLLLMSVHSTEADDPIANTRTYWVMIAALTYVYLGNLLQILVTNLKLRALSWRCAPMCCSLLLGFTAVGLPVMVLEGAGVRFRGPFSFLYYSLFATLCLPCVWLIQFCCLFFEANKSLLRYFSGEADAWITVRLFITAFLVLLGSALSGIAGFLLNGTKLLQQPLWLTADTSFQLLCTLLLSGMLGPRSWANSLEDFQRRAVEAGFGLTQSRIAFPGKICEENMRCVVSFPGKYSGQWDQLVSSASEEGAVCSVACVFLTDSTTGLGQHSLNPEMPGQCWCRAIYGQVPPEAYLATVDETRDTERERAFKRADAKAMNQHLLVYKGQPQADWEHDLTRAMRKATESCQQNHGRAPWGCRWFEDWKKTLDYHEKKRCIRSFARSKSGPVVPQVLKLQKL